MIIPVKHKHIVNAVLNSRDADPIALAARDAGLPNARVGRKTLSWDHHQATEEGTLVSRTVVPLGPDLIALLKRLEYEPREEVFKMNDNGQYKPFGFLIGEGQV